MSLARPPRGVLGWAGPTGQAASMESQHGAGEKLLAVSRSLPFDLAGSQIGPGFWEGLGEPLCPAAGTGISGGRRG